MRYFPSIAAGTLTLRHGRPSALGAATKTLLAVVLGALHDSRQREAERTLRRYRHLLDPAARATQGGANDRE